MIKFDVRRNRFYIIVSYDKSSDDKSMIFTKERAARIVNRRLPGYSVGGLVTTNINNFSAAKDAAIQVGTEDIAPGSTQGD